MAVIVVEVPDVEGESQVEGYADKLEALSIRETLEIPLPSTVSGQSAARTVGQAKHSDIELTRHKDKASPKLAQACSAGDNLGTVKIHLFRTLEGGLKVYMTYELENAYVSRIEQETLDDSGSAYGPHLAGPRPIRRPRPPLPRWEWRR